MMRHADIKTTMTFYAEVTDTAEAAIWSAALPAENETPSLAMQSA
jgi:hypothetical protein